MENYSNQVAQTDRLYKELSNKKRIKARLDHSTSVYIRPTGPQFLTQSKWLANMFNRYLNLGLLYPNLSNIHKKPEVRLITSGLSIHVLISFLLPFSGELILKSSRVLVKI